MSDVLQQLADKVEELDKANAVLLEAQLALANAEKAVEELAQKEIPNLLESVGLNTITTRDGLKVTIKETVHARLSGETKDAALKWLEENGHSGLIRREVKIPFTREEEEACRELAEQLQGEYPDLTMDRNVHHSTLRSFVRGELEEDTGEFPRDLFNVYIKKTAQIEK